MKLVVLQDNLNKALTVVSRFALVKAQLPILSNVLFSAQKTKLILAATNLETSISISLGAQIKEEGKLALPARAISEIISNLLPTPVSLGSHKESLQITTPSFSAKITGMNAGDFPAVPQTISSKEGLILPKTDFLEALGQVLFSTSIDETRPILTGVLLIFENPPAAKQGSLTLVATDGFRLSQKKIKLESPCKPGKLVLPKNVFLEMGRMGEAGESFLFEFRPKENQVVFDLGGPVLSSRILEGNFPPFEKIIPKSSTSPVRCEREELLRAVKLASVFARDSANIVKISFAKDFLQVFAESSSTGSQQTKIEATIDPSFVKAAENERFEIAFNYRFLEDFLKAVSGEEVNLAFSDPASPGVFTDPKDPDYLHLIMPVKLQG